MGDGGRAGGGSEPGGGTRTSAGELLLEAPPPQSLPEPEVSPFLSSVKLVGNNNLEQKLFLETEENLLGPNVYI